MNHQPDSFLRPALCNHAVAGIGENERARMMALAAAKIGELLDVLHIDHRIDHNTRDTPTRVAKMLVEETLRGRYTEPPKITEFDNAEGCEQLIVTGPIEVRSTCAHHLMPIFGHAYIGILPAADGKLLGLSKYDRIVEYFSARLQIQEELVNQIGKYIQQVAQPRGLAVRISAVHMCKTHRGVKSSRRSRMVNSFYSGELADIPALRAEFLHECASLERCSGE